MNDPKELRKVLTVRLDDEKKTISFKRNFKDGNEMFSVWVAVNRLFMELVVKDYKYSDYTAIQSIQKAVDSAVKEFEDSNNHITFHQNKGE